MSRLTMSLVILSLGLAAHATMPQEPVVVVAVIDTGIAEELVTSKMLCKTGHKDFTGTSIVDHHGHGTHVSGLIDQYVKNIVLDDKPISLKIIQNKPAKYCQIILKYFDSKQDTDTLEAEIQAFREAIKLNVDVINFSGGGEEYSAREHALIKEALDLGIKVVVAAGNEKSNISKRPYYPAALDSRLYVVGNLMKDNKRAPTSNYGPKVTSWEYGTNRTSYGLKNQVTIMTGTSQAAGVKSGKLVRQMLNKR